MEKNTRTRADTFSKIPSDGSGTGKTQREESSRVDSSEGGTMYRASTGKGPRRARCIVPLQEDEPRVLRRRLTECLRPGPCGRRRNPPRHAEQSSRRKP